MRSETLLGVADAIEDADRHTVLVPCRSGDGDSRTSDRGTSSDPSMPPHSSNHPDVGTIRVACATRGGITVVSVVPAYCG